MSRVFSSQTITLGLHSEEMICGGPDSFPLLKNIFAGIRQIAVIGFGSQGLAQALNLRDSLSGSGIKLKLGLRRHGNSWQRATEAGFIESEGTLGEVYPTAGESDLVLWLIPDAEQADEFPMMFKALKPGTTLGLSHGFLLGHLQNLGLSFPVGVNVIGVCPKAMGFLLRQKYLLGKGFPATVAIHQDVTGQARQLAISWAIGAGCSPLFFTTLRNEYIGNSFGESGILLGALHGISQVLTGAESLITGPLSQIISRNGLDGFYHSLPLEDQKIFMTAYSTSYLPMKKIMDHLYQEVACGRGVALVVDANKLKNKQKILAGDVTNFSGAHDVSMPQIAAIYIACMIAQVDVMLAMHHKPSEVCLESVVDAVSMLNPYIKKTGLDHTLENCSLTAAVLAKIASPRFSKIIIEKILPKFSELNGQINSAAFLAHPIHKMLKDFFSHV